MILNTIDYIRKTAIAVPLVNMCSFGDIQLYNHKPNIFYPYVNLDVVEANVPNYQVKYYRVRIYVCDRNEPYVAYNKTEQILDNLINALGVEDYVVRYFNNNFQDNVHGVWTDILFPSIMDVDCLVDIPEGFILTQDNDFVNSEHEEYLKQEKYDG